MNRIPMRYIPITVEIFLDGHGMYYDLNEPPMLAGMDYQAQGRLHKRFTETPSRDEEPLEQRLSFAKSKINGHSVYHASAFFPEGAQYEELLYLRKKFQINRIELTKGSPNLQMATYREYNIPLPKITVTKLIAYGMLAAPAKERRRKNTHSPLSQFRHEFGRFFTHVGKKRSVGLGKIVRINIEQTTDDWSLVKDGQAMTYLPDETGWRLSRARPPFWNNCDRIPVCEIGDPYKLPDGIMAPGIFTE